MNGSATRVSTVLVADATGYLGWHLVRTADDGFRVRALARDLRKLGPLRTRVQVVVKADAWDARRWRARASTASTPSTEPMSLPQRHPFWKRVHRRCG
jgi:nucleoside-diphosphate-sugar epimerase